MMRLFHLEPYKVPRRLLIYSVFKSLASFKAWHIGCLDLDHGTSLWVTPGTRCTVFL